MKDRKLTDSQRKDLVKFYSVITGRTINADKVISFTNQKPKQTYIMELDEEFFSNLDETVANGATVKTLC